MINYENIVVKIIKLATNIVNTVLDEIKHFQETSLKLQLLQSIQRFSDKNIQQNSLQKMKKNFVQDKVLLEIVEDYINRKPGSIKNLDRTIHNFEKIYDVSLKELKRLDFILPKYYPQEIKIKSVLKTFLSAIH